MPKRNKKKTKWSTFNPAIIESSPVSAKAGASWNNGNVAVAAASVPIQKGGIEKDTPSSESTQQGSELSGNDSHQKSENNNSKTISGTVLPEVVSLSKTDGAQSSNSNQVPIKSYASIHREGQDNKETEATDESVKSRSSSNDKVSSSTTIDSTKRGQDGIQMSGTIGVTSNNTWSSMGNRGERRDVSGQYQNRNSNYGQRNQSYEYNKHGEGHVQQKRSRNDTFILSKSLATLLRHGYPKDIVVDDCGFAKINEIINHPFFRKFRTSPSEIQEIVEQNDKKRFQLSEDLQCIRAVQGHSRKFEEEKIGMKLIEDPSKFPNVFHGTYWEYWKRIEKEGLKRMSRNHVHFAIGERNEAHVTSGMKRDSEIILKLDLAEAIKDGFKFYLSTNNVVLAQGDEHGTVPPKYINIHKSWDYDAERYKLSNPQIPGLQNK